MQKITIPKLQSMKCSGEKIVALTAYDASFAAIMEKSGVEVILVGDSLGMVVHGYNNTLSVTVNDVIYHCKWCRNGAKKSMLVADIPFLGSQSLLQTCGSAARLLGEGMAEMVKIEGGANLAKVVERLVKRGIPVCGHIGLLPQQINQLGNYKMQGKTPQAVKKLLEDARILEAAGISILVIESVPASVAQVITEQASIPTIGIGAGPFCNGQILVMHDMLGVSEKQPLHSQNFMQGNSSITKAMAQYVQAVKSGTFPKN